MKILDRHIGRAVAGGTAIVMLVLLALESFFAFAQELGDVGQGSYTVGAAAKFVLLAIPGSLYQLFPMAALLGTILGLGALAAQSELIVVRAAGVSLLRIAGSVMRVGVLMMMLATFIGELAAPPAEQLAQRSRAIAKTDRISLKTGTSNGYWARDGRSYINIREVLPGGRLGGIYIYDLDARHRLRMATYAERAAYEDGRWQLENLAQSLIGEDKVTTRYTRRAPWETLLSPALIDVVVVRPESLSAYGLHEYVDYLEENGLTASRYELAFWFKVFQPIATGVMVLLAIPFVFGLLRSGSLGHRIVVGTLAGFGFHLFSRVFGHVSVVFDLSPFLGASLPTLVAAVLAVVLMRRVP